MFLHLYMFLHVFTQVIIDLDWLKEKNFMKSEQEQKRDTLGNPSCQGCYENLHCCKSKLKVKFCFILDIGGPLNIHMLQTVACLPNKGDA